MDNRFNNIKKVIAGGCSFTAGSELADESWDRPHKGICHELSYTAWPNLLQQRMFVNAKVDNTAVPGADYGSIVRRIIYQTRHNLRIHKPEDIVVVVMWTSILRREYPSVYPVGRKIKTHEDRFLTSLPSDGDGRTKGYSNAMLYSRRQMWASEHLTRTNVEFYARRDTHDNHVYYPLQQLEYLTNWLENHNIKYFFTSAFKDIEPELLNQDNVFFQDMIGRLDLPNLVHKEDGIGFWDWASKNNYKRGNESDHPLEEAHSDWTDLFAKWILTKCK